MYLLFIDDHSRVVLKDPPTDSNYINANYIKVTVSCYMYNYHDHLIVYCFRAVMNVETLLLPRDPWKPLWTNFGS